MTNPIQTKPSIPPLSVLSPVKTGTPRLANMKWIEKQVINSAKTSQATARLIVASNVIKDAINCVFYTYLSATNKKIPEEKRGFVAAVDLVNGILMCGSQWVLGFWVTSDTAQKKIARTILPKNFEKNFPERFEKCTGGIKAFTGLVVATIFAKRLIVPFLSVPIAGPVKRMAFDKKPDKNKQPENKPAENKQQLNKTV